MSFGTRAPSVMLRALAMGACFALFGCATGDSLLERGERVETGRRRLDAYFSEVTELREKVRALDSDLFPLRQPLVEELKLDVDTPLPELMAAAKKRIDKLKSFGVLIGLRIAPNPVVIVVAGELGQDEGDEGALKAIQEAAVRALATYREYQQLFEVALRLDEQRAELVSGLDRLPTGVDNTAMIETEIVGAGRVLREVQNKLLKDSRTSAYFLVALSEAVDAGGLQADLDSCLEAKAHWKPPKKPGRGRARGIGSTGGGGGRGGPDPGAAGTRPLPPPPPAPPPAGGDFDM